MAEATNVKVYTRFRPFNKREIALGGDSTGFLNINKLDHSIKLTEPSACPGGVSFNVDHAFDIDSTQDQVYNVICAPTIGDLFGGFNATIFAYGQTGAGKSHTMMGSLEGDGSLAGIIPRASEHIFNTIRSELRGITFEVSVSYIEVYREVIRDLLDSSKQNLRVRESPGRGVYVDGMTSEFVTSEDDVLQVLAIGDESRAVAATNMNATSSRSHSILIVTVSQKNQEDGSSRQGQLNLVDLAGSEKIGKTGATGQTLEEAKKINQSLSALSNVIKGLADGAGHVPYRDSKLTRILQSSLGGNTKTSLITAASPHPDNAAETLSTLRFGQRAKTIKTKVKANEQRSAEELAKMLEKLQNEIAQLRGYNAALEAKLTEAGIELPSAGESASAAKSASAGVVDGAANARLTEEHDKLKESHRLMQEELTDLKSENADATAEARQAEAREAILKGHLSRFQALSKRAAGEMKHLRQELHERNQQVTQSAPS
jgi:kinesin family protein 5